MLSIAHTLLAFHAFLGGIIAALFTHAGIDSGTLDPFYSRSAARSRSWARWTRWPPTLMGTSRAAPAPSLPRLSTSSENLFDLFMAQSSQSVEPPRYPGWFRVVQQVLFRSSEPTACERAVQQHRGLHVTRPALCVSLLGQQGSAFGTEQFQHIKPSSTKQVFRPAKDWPMHSCRPPLPRWPYSTRLAPLTEQLSASDQRQFQELLLRMLESRKG